MIHRPLALTASDLEAFRQCFVSNGSLRTLHTLEWQYAHNPTGKLFVDVAVADNKFAAIYASLPINVLVDGKRRLALQSLDTLTDRDHRGKGLFVKLAGETFARARNDGAAFVYGFPNGQSAPGFFGKLGWTTLDPVPFLVRPLRSRYLLRRLPQLESLARTLPDVTLAVRERGGEVDAIRRFDTAIDSLWSSFSTGKVGVSVDRDAAYMNWRLTDKPGCSYTHLIASSHGQVNALVSFAIYDKHEGRIGYVMECLARPNHARTASRLLRSAVRCMAHDRADLVLAWCFPHSPNYRLYLSALFVPFPVKLRPIELHIGVRVLDESIRRAVSDRRNWYVSYLDSDTV